MTGLRLVLALLAAALLIFIPSRAHAHDFGSMKVVATIADGRYAFDVTLFPEHLPASLRPGAFDSHDSYARAFAVGASIRFDDVAVAPELTLLAPPASDSTDPAEVPGATLRLSGVVPRGAARLVWSHGWPADDYLLCARARADQEPDCQWVRGTAAAEPVVLGDQPAPSSTARVFVEYAQLGFTHILPKELDHILFVLSLFLLSLKPRAILTQVTAFTLAHSITLALSIYGVVRLPSSIVEPLIAASIVAVAVENIVARKARPHRAAMVFAFGLLHGLGFAGVLSEMGLPRTQFVPALVAFNIGVELGQLAVIAGAFAAVGIWFGRKPWYRSAITVPASVAIAAIGLWWTVQRIGLLGQA